MWAGATTLVAAAAQQPYAHYLLPAIVPLALAVASLPRPRPTLPAGAGARSLAAGILIAVGLASVVRGDWVFHEGWLFQYYGGAVGVATQRWSLASWQRASFDSRVAGDEQVCDYIRSHGLTGARTVVWSSDAWPYLLCDLPLLLPTAPIYNNQVLFGEHGPVARKVEALDPELIVTSADDVEQFPEIKPLLDQRYRRVVDASPNELWVRTD